MKYMLLIYADGSKRPDFTPEQRRAAVQAWVDFEAEAKAAGVIVSNESLYPVTDATTLRVRDGKRLTTDGPFAETEEQLGGYYVIDCADLDEALDWAAKMPGAKYGTIEIRPVMTFERK